MNFVQYIFVAFMMFNTTVGFGGTKYAITIEELNKVFLNNILPSTRHEGKWVESGNPFNDKILDLGSITTESKLEVNRLITTLDEWGRDTQSILGQISRGEIHATNPNQLELLQAALKRNKDYVEDVKGYLKHTPAKNNYLAVTSLEGKVLTMFYFQKVPTLPAYITLSLSFSNPNNLRKTYLVEEGAVKYAGINTRIAVLKYIKHGNAGSVHEVVSDAESERSADALARLGFKIKGEECPKVP